MILLQLGSGGQAEGAEACPRLLPLDLPLVISIVMVKYLERMQNMTTARGWAQNINQILA